MAIRPELLDELLKECENPEELLSQNGLLKELTKGLVERMLHAEMTDHLGMQPKGTTAAIHATARRLKSSRPSMAICR